MFYSFNILFTIADHAVSSLDKVKAAESSVNGGTMSGRRRRSDSLWDRKEEEGTQTEISGKVPYSSFRGDGSPKRSNFEANNDGSRQPMHGNDNIPMDNDNSSGRHGMKMDPAFDEWESQYSSRPSDNSYDLPYRFAILNFFCTFHR